MTPCSGWLGRSLVREREGGGIALVLQAAQYNPGPRARGRG